jgi:hypothetical protein
MTKGIVVLLLTVSAYQVLVVLLMRDKSKAWATGKLESTQPALLFGEAGYGITQSHPCDSPHRCTQSLAHKTRSSG